MRDSLRKDVSKQMAKYKDFLVSIDSNIMEIFSYGFSFSNVDLPYIKLICSRLSIDIIWYLKTYEGQNFSELIIQRNNLIKCGFVGKIKIF